MTTHKKPVKTGKALSYASTSNSDISLLIAGFIFAGLAWALPPTGGVEMVAKLSEAKAKEYLLERYGPYNNRVAKFRTDEVVYQGHTYTPRDFLIDHRRHEVRFKTQNRLYWAAGLAFMLMLSHLLWSLFFKKKEKPEALIRGAECVDAKTLTKKLEKEKIASKYKIAGVPMVKGSEIQHTLLLGSTGTGKTSAMADLVHQARRDGVSMVIYDFNGYYTSTLYRDGDTILNPFDTRMPSWDIWQETRHRPDFDLIAATQIPRSNSPEVEQWNQFARTLYASTAHALDQTNDRSTDKLMYYLLQASPAELLPIVGETEAKNLTQPEFAKFAMSIKSVLSSHLKSMQYLPQETDGFSIREWVEKEDKKGACVFITTQPRYHESLRPLLTLWLDLFLSAAVDLPPDADRRLFFLMDEFPTLYKLPKIEHALSTIRKNGVGIFLGAQSHSQIYDIYGAHAAEGMMSNCNTCLYFRCNNQVAASYCAKELGDKEVQDTVESVSKSQDGKVQRTKQRTKQTKQVVLTSEILHLPDLTAFLRLKGIEVIAKVSFEYAQYAKMTESIIERDISKPIENDFPATGSDFNYGE